MFVLLFIAVVGFSLFMSWLEFSDNSEWALPNGKQVSLYTADIEGDHIKNANPIDESDIARVSDSSIYIQRSALVADPSYIYIPEWKVKILGQNAGQTIKNEFTWDKIAKKMLKDINLN